MNAKVCQVWETEAVIVHHGTQSGSSHYVTYINQEGVGAVWVKHDDEKTLAATAAEVGHLPWTWSEALMEKQQKGKEMSIMLQNSTSGYAACSTRTGPTLDAAHLKGPQRPER